MIAEDSVRFAHSGPSHNLLRPAIAELVSCGLLPLRKSIGLHISRTLYWLKLCTARAKTDIFVEKTKPPYCFRVISVYSCQRTLQVEHKQLCLSDLNALRWVFLAHLNYSNILHLNELRSTSLSRPEKSLPQNGNFYAT